MATRVRNLLTGALDAFRYEPTDKRVRAVLDGDTVADTRSARLVWEPRRVVPTYAVPEADLRATLSPATPVPEFSGGLRFPDVSDRPVLDPSVPFAAHSSPGTPLDVEASGRVLPGAAFRPDDPDLAGYLVLDFDAFTWLDENTPVVGHPRDPFHRIDVLPSDRHVRLELDGVLLAESPGALLLFETMLPVRFYLDAAELAAPLHPSDTTTQCAYKGTASYLSADLPGGDDIAWYYPDPLLDATPVRDRIAFFTESLDLTLDGVPVPRPVTPWSR